MLLIILVIFLKFIQKLITINKDILRSKTHVLHINNSISKKKYDQYYNVKELYKH